MVLNSRVTPIRALIKFQDSTLFGNAERMLGATMGISPQEDQSMIRRHSLSCGLWFPVGLAILSLACLRPKPLYAAPPGADVPLTNNFATPADLAAWQMDYPEDWEILKDGNLPYLHMKRSREPGVPRRPVQFARLRNAVPGSFTLDVRVRRAQRSLIVVFDYVDTLHFYYAHISVDPGSENLPHNGIFIVDGGPRRRIAGAGSMPALPDRAWRDVKIVRDVSSGSIQVFVNKETMPRFSVIDHTFTQGQVGLGSFDETGDFAAFRLHVND